MLQLRTQRELDGLRASADLVARTLGEVARFVEPGISTFELDREAERFVRSHDAEPAFKGYRIPGPAPFPSTLCVSVNDEIVHGIPGGYRLREGDLVSVDCGVRLNGYYGDSAFTFALGSISSTCRALCNVTYRALLSGISQAVAGNRVGDISHAVERYCNGYGVVRDLVGHGIGRKLHEPPQIPNFGRPGRGALLRRGATLCIEPMINLGTPSISVDSDGWTVRTADGTPSAHYEHMVAVDRGAPEILTTFRYIEDVVTPPYHLLPSSPANGKTETSSAVRRSR